MTTFLDPHPFLLELNPYALYPQCPGPLSARFLFRVTFPMIRYFSALSLVLLASSLFSGCGGSAPEDDGPGISPFATQCGAVERPFVVRAEPATNMTLTTNLVFNPTPVAANNTGLTFDWSGVTHDFYGHPIDWNEIVMAALVIWAAPPAQIAQLINDDDPSLDSYLAYPPAQLPLNPTIKQAAITDFVDAGGGSIPLEDLQNKYLDGTKGYTYTLILQDVPSAGFGARVIHSFTLEPGNPATAVTVQNASTTLTGTAVLGQPTQVPVMDPHVAINWDRTLTTRSFGGAFDENKITEVLVGRFDPSFDLQAPNNILNLETAPTALYSGSVQFLEPFDLSQLTNAAGEAFPGIDTANHWYLALACGGETCRNPSPWYLTKLEPCAAQ